MKYYYQFESKYDSTSKMYKVEASSKTEIQRKVLHKIIDLLDDDDIEATIEQLPEIIAWDIRYLGDLDNIESI